MHIDLGLTPEQQEQLAGPAHHEGTSLDAMLTSAALLLLRADQQHLAAIEEGVRQADSGDLFDHDAVLTRVNALLGSQ